MHRCLIVKLELLWLTLLDVEQMRIKDLLEAGPKHIDANLFKEVVEDADSIHPLHLQLALLIDLDHD